MCRRKPARQNQLDPSRRFDKTPTYVNSNDGLFRVAAYHLHGLATDGQTDTRLEGGIKSPLEMAWMDNIKTWTGLSVEESIRMTEDRDKWRKYAHGVANPRMEDG